MEREVLLNNYYNEGGFNKPARIGYVMQLIRELHPLTEEEWKNWYLAHVHDETYLQKLACEFHQCIPASENVSVRQCQEYMHDVMFRRTFNGYNREKAALVMLRKIVSPDVKEAPAVWDVVYFIDFFVTNRSRKLIGIQLKPESFFLGHYENKINIRERMLSFCKDQHAAAVLLVYKEQVDGDSLTLANPKALEKLIAKVQV